MCETNSDCEKLFTVITKHTNSLSENTNLLRLVNTKVLMYRRKRQQHLRNILMLRNRSLVISAQNKGNRKIWTKNRTGRFFEEDAQQNGEYFFKENFRMSKACFELLCSKLHGLQKQDTVLRKCIPLNKRIGIAVYALGSSAEYRTIANLFGVGKSTVCELVQEFCQEVWQVMRHQYLDTFPLTNDRIADCVKGFEAIGFPQCYGAIDGCHIEIRPRQEEAVDYHNYKGWYSTVLFACVDYRYRFQYIHVGSPGRCNDSKIFESSNLKKELESPNVGLHTKSINGIDVPVLLIGDSAFRLSSKLMKPFPFRADAPTNEKNFNYFLSRARRVVENAFGHIKARFRRIGKGLDNRCDKVNLIIKACCVLHNFLNTHNDAINQHWIQQMRDNERSPSQIPEEVVTLGDCNPSGQAVREAIANYFAEQSAKQGAETTEANVAV